MNWIKKLLCAIDPRKLVLAGIKKAVVYEIVKEGDKLQAKLREALKAEGPEAVDRLIDGTQARIIIFLKNKGPMWAWINPLRNKMADAIQEFGDKLQAGIQKHVTDYGPTAVDMVFDQAQAELISKIEQVSL